MAGMRHVLALALLVGLWLGAGCRKAAAPEAPLDPQALVGTWRLDPAATRADLVARRVWTADEAAQRLPDSRDIRWRVDAAHWTLEVDGQVLVNHDGTYTPSPTGGELTGLTIGGRPTVMELTWGEPGQSFWAVSRNHSLWPGYREFFRREPQN